MRSPILGRLIAALSVLAVLFGGPSALAQSDIICDPSGGRVCAVEATGLPLRLLIKPQSNMYADPDVSSVQAHSNIPAFSVLYAYEQLDVVYDDANFTATGWFRAGFRTDGPEGYVRAEDVVPWKQALAVAFTNPGPSERKPVLMFASGDALSLTMEEILDGTLVPDDLYTAVAANDIPEGIISREGTGWVDINKNFYLMPILNYTPMGLSGDDLLGLQVAALTNQGRADQVDACDINAADASQCFAQQTGGGVSSIALDMVFVIDTTLSMQASIDAVTSSIREAALALEQKMQNSEQLKFGIVGYRDSPEAGESTGEGGSFALEYTAKSFTPELLTTTDFRDLLASGEIRASAAGSGDWQEEVFAGMQEGINSNWSPASARVIVLIGDASSHGIDHPKNSSGLSEIAIKELAKQNEVYVASIYVGDEDLNLARPQFEGMSAGDETSVAFAVVDTGGEGGIATSLAKALKGIVDAVTSGRLGSVTTAAIDPDDSVSQAVLGAVRAAFVDYLGTEAEPPANITAWALDRDPTDYQKRAFDVKVMVQNGELQELINLLKAAQEKFVGGASTSLGFLDTVVGVSTGTSYDLNIADSQAIGESDLAPKWIKALPYKSLVLTMSPEEFTQAPPDDRTRFEQRLTSLIELYDDILNRPQDWVALNDQSNAEDKVYMLDLSNLP